ncbi:PIR Superfamily Protein [Plasmodium ovale wallikeri]|uniref:PIR Superfamily Protein n=1 Tax=Plasmodium ovale wallikeri TaxID=864142 RepID=A0A1A9ALB8_PLAOA|nr:PIR Superfamily Protein [Plasmodium ovale wallikeri]SBT58010.1 PIR Superfamily Protein [Plasmodium ovale wallikeri]
MVQSPEFSGGFKKENLPSNKYKIELCKNHEIPKLEERTSNVNEYYDCEEPVQDFYKNFITNHDNLETECKKNGPKCCRDVNYYIDLVTGIIRASHLDDSDKSKLIKKVETEWEPNIRAKNIYTCERETDVDSIRKRCILQHLYDLKEDENNIFSFSEEYKSYLDEKWKKILSYTNETPDKLFIKIENNSMGIIENYNNFLGSPDYICYNNLDKLNEEEITFSRDLDSLINSISLDRMSPNDDKNICYNKNYVDMLKYKTLNIQKMNNLLFIGVALLGFSLILIFLYDYSPLGNWFRRCTKKKIEVDENESEEFPELYENSENIERYITYPSMSH